MVRRCYYPHRTIEIPNILSLTSTRLLSIKKKIKLGSQMSSVLLRSKFGLL